MLTAARALSSAGAVDPLPEVFPLLSRHGVRPMRGEVTMLAGVANAGKSMFGLYYALQLAQKGERVLYFSADSSEMTQATRLAAMLTGQSISGIREAVASGGLAYYEDVLADVDIRLDFNSNPTLDDIDLTMAAYEETFGAWPTVCLIDNLMNVETGDSDNEKSGLIEIQKVLKYICRQTDVAILLMHHCSEAEGKPNQPPPRKMIQQKVSELPELILTVAYDGESSRYGLAAVKNRHGKADPGAKNPTWLWADMDSGRFFDDRAAAFIAGVAV